jgi:prepilin signal peptidase PulO-like enzyme (type II secretory pathway)
MIAYSDLIFGRIPQYFIFFSGLMGIFLDVLQKQVGFRLMGGLFTFGIMYLIFLLGKYYLGRRIEQGRSYSGFGLGDIYASGALGFLFGFSRGLLAILFALVIALAYAYFQTVVRKEHPFLKARIRLGPFFLMSTIIVVFWVNLFI